MPAKQRSKLALYNMIFGLIYEAVLAISGILIPRFILLYYGSATNGLISSITQFLSIIALLKGGVGGVTRAALYKPLSENNKIEVDRILKATSIFLKKISIIFVLGVIALACSYYFFIEKDSFSWLFCFLLVIILAFGTFSQYFFGMTSQLLLQADQKGYIYYVFQTVATIVNIGLCILLIMCGRTVHEVKLGTALIYSVCPILLAIYTMKKYKVNHKVEPNNNSIKQRWDAFGYQIATYIHENTDIILLTFFCPLAEVSVYNIYSLIINACIRRILETFFGGFDAAIGDMYARNEMDNLKKVMKLYNVLVAVSSAVFFSCTMFLMPSFIDVYTSGVSDVSYQRSTFLIILVIAEFIYCLRMPYYSIITALGKYKETKIGAYLEAAINIAISLSLIWKLGIVGVAIGTLIAMAFRWIYMLIYTHKKILKQNWLDFIKQLLVSACIFGACFGTSYIIKLWTISNFFVWVGSALLVFALVLIIGIGISFVFFKETTLDIFRRVKHLFFKKRAVIKT